MVPNLELAQTDVLIVVVMGEYDLIKDFLLFNKLVHSVQAVGRKLLILVQIVMVREINKLQKKYLLQFQKVLMMEPEFV